MGLTPFPEEEHVKINKSRANIATENMRKKAVSKVTYADIVRNQPDIKDSQVSRIRRTHRSLKMWQI